MKRYIKITIWAILAIVLVGVCVIGGLVLKNYLQDKMSPAFEETTIFPDNKFNPTDTVLTVNGVDVKMVGIRSGKVCCEGLRDTIELQDFYIAETEVTQKLWTAIMGNNPSGNQECDSLPVESVDLVECLDFVHKLDSVSGLDFYIPSYPQWVYAANLGKCDSNQTHSSGKTFDDSLILINEAENYSKEEMLLIMTRIGENSKIVITGDLEQCDRKDIKQTNKMCGLEYACAKLKDLEEFGSVEFGVEDIVRNPIITKIITKWKE